MNSSHPSTFGPISTSVAGELRTQPRADTHPDVVQPARSSLTWDMSAPVEADFQNRGALVAIDVDADASDTLVRLHPSTMDSKHTVDSKHTLPAAVRDTGSPHLTPIILEGQDGGGDVVVHVAQLPPSESSSGCAATALRIRNAVTNGMSAAGSAVSNAADRVSTALEPVGDAMSSAANRVSRTLEPVGNAMSRVAGSVVTALEPVGEAVSIAAARVSTALQPLTDAVSSAATTVSTALEPITSRLPDGQEPRTALLVGVVPALAGTAGAIYGSVHDQDDMIIGGAAFTASWLALYAIYNVRNSCSVRAGDLA